MFADSVLERTGFRYPNGASHDAMLSGFRRRVREARKFVLTKEAVAMAASVSLSRPSSIVAALNWVRLKSDPMWIEFSNADLREAMANMGSPNIRHEHAVSEIVRSGFLLRSTDEGFLTIEYVHADRTDRGDVITDLAPVLMTFDLSDQEMPRVSTAIKPSLRGVDGKLRRHLEWVSKDPKEAAAEASLRDRFAYVSHPDMKGARDFIVKIKGEDGAELTEENQASEGWRLFNNLGLSTLILLNCRNAVATTEVVPSAKLNKNRSAKGKEPLQAYETVTMHLSAAAQRRQAASGDGSGSRAATIVFGHFKVRKSGVFYWNEHFRSGHGEAKPKTVIVRA
ncbi:MULTISPECIES: hypothetical protein [unclassified Bradyrhizobium]